jgi:hypothetical protein
MTTAQIQRQLSLIPLRVLVNAAKSLGLGGSRGGG